LFNIVGSFSREKRTELRFVRPDDADLEKYYKEISTFFEIFIASFPELSEYFKADGAGAKLVIERERFKKKNILFRAVGLEIFMRLVVFLTKQKMSRKLAVNTLVSLPRQFTEKPYRDVLYSASEGKILLGRTRLTIRLLRYMLGCADRDQSELRKAYAEALGADEKATKLPPRIASAGRP
jgi:DNA sulfur modification protein DndB